MTHSPAFLLHFYQKPSFLYGVDVISFSCIIYHFAPLYGFFLHFSPPCNHNTPKIGANQGLFKVFSNFQEIKKAPATSTFLSFSEKRDVTDAFLYPLYNFIDFYTEQELLFPTPLHLCLFTSMLHMPDNDPYNGKHHKYGCKCH